MPVPSLKAMKRLLLCSFAFAVTLSPSSAQEEMTKEIMVEGVRANLSAYESVKIPKDGSPASFTVRLGETTSIYQGKIVFDGLRITVPKDLGERDFIWYFNAPESWANWFIIPVEGDFEGGFRNWLNADKRYRDFDKPKEPDRRRVLQSLANDYLKPGKDYILWFRRVDEGADAELRGALMFAERPEDEREWSHAALEKTLKLKSAPAAAQAEQLRSRGARILLDKDFFDPDEAEDRIDQVFFDLRQTRWLKGGFFVTMRISCPPCHKKPSLALIRKKHGEPDFIQSSEEEARISQAGGQPADADEKTVTHFYDYFGFEVAVDDPAQKVLRVTTQAGNFGDLRPPDDKPFYGRVALKNLTVFRDHGREVGRMFYFLEGRKKPVIMQEPPPGTYLSGHEALEYQGKGRWLWLTHEGMKVVRRVPFENHQMQGQAEGFHDDGSRSFTAKYKSGEIDGEVVEYMKDGTVKSRRTYRNGKRVTEEKESVDPPDKTGK